MQWDALDESEKAKYPYQLELKRRLDGIMSDLNKKLQRNTERLTAQDKPALTASEQVEFTAQYSGCSNMCCLLPAKSVAPASEARLHAV